MHLVHEVDRSGLKSAVTSQVAETLKRARQSLEAYYDDPEDRRSIDDCIRFLHEVQGSLVLSELTGAALLAEHMERVARDIRDQLVGDRESAVESLLRATLQLPNYLDRVQAGYRDLPVALLPVVNDLRAACDQPALSEADLFAPDLSVRPPGFQAQAAEDVRAVARRLRPVYQSGLLALLRGGGGGQGLERIAGVVDEMQRAVTLPEAARLWWVAGGLVEAVQEGGVSSIATLRPILAQLDRQLKAHMEHGEGAASSEEAAGLVRQMLYLVGRSSSSGNRVEDLRDAFGLEHLLPSAEDVGAAQDSLSGATAALVETVTGALREDLTRVMETIDLYARREERNVADLRPLADKLTEMGDTLAMLGAMEARGRLLAQAAALGEMVENSQSADSGALMDIAGALVRIEGSLDAIVAPRRPHPEGEEAPLLGVEHRQLTQAVLREARENIGQVKEILATYLTDPSSAADLERVVDGLDEVRGGLAILGLDAPADAAARCAAYIQHAVEGREALPEQAELDDLAEAIAGLEFFLESFDEAGGGTEAVMRLVEETLARLPGADLSAADRGLVPEVSAAQGESEGMEVEGPVAELTLEPAAEARPPAEEGEIPVFEVEEGTLEEAAGPAAEAMGGEAEAPTEEGELPVFEIEEGTLEEVVEAPVPPAAEEVVVGVEAPTEEGELPAFEVEEGVPEEVVEAAVPPAAEVVEVEAEAPAEEGEMAAVEAEEGAPEGVAEAAVPAIAEEVGGEAEAPAEEGERPTFEIEEGVAEVPAEAPIVPLLPADVVLPEVAVDPDADPELVEIFVEEAGEELGSIDTMQPRWFADPGDEEALGTLRRSYHTLKGSGRMVGARLVGELAWSVENMLNRVIDGSVQPSGTMVTVLEQVRQALEGLVAQLSTGQEAGDVLPLVATAWALARGEAVEPPAPFEAKRPEVVEEAPAETPEVSPEALPVTERDPVLMGIFRDEARGHLTTVRDFVAACRSAEGGCEVSDALIRALHTIHGSARMAEVGDIADLGGALEHLVKDVAAVQAALSPAILDLLEDSAAGVERCLDGLLEGEEPLPDKQALLDRVAGLQAEAAAHPAPTAEAEAVPAEKPSGLVEIFLDEAVDLLQEADTALQSWSEARDDLQPLGALVRDVHTLKGGAFLAGFDPIGDLSKGTEQLLEAVRERRLAPDREVAELLGRSLDRLWLLLEKARDGVILEPAQDLLSEQEALLPSEAGAPEEVPAEPEAERPAEVDPSTLDADLVQAFLDEGDEILANIDTLVQRLAGDVTNTQLVGELRRELHTLKGGGRMCGLTPVGDLSHALESMIQGVVDGHLPASQRVIELLQYAQDQLADMLERTRRMAPVPVPGPMIAAIEDYTHQGIAGQMTDAEIAQLVRQEQPALLEPLTAEESPEAAQARERRAGSRMQQEQVRVRADLLNQLVNYAGEVSIARTRIEEQIAGFGFNLQELDQTTSRLRGQLRKLEIETEAQILFRYEAEAAQGVGDFDPLELDRYSTVQQLSRSLMESVSDLVSLHDLLLEETRDAETLLLQQARVTTELQEGLMQTRMVPFAGLAPRLRRIARQTAQELSKRVELRLEGSETELDRSVLERMVGPLEHLLRNAVNHGIEEPATRRAVGKAETGNIRIALRREGQEILIQVADDGCGLDLEAIRRKAVDRGLLSPGARLADREVMQFILESGFSTAREVTQIAGRGVGLDVVKNEVKLLSGSLVIDSGQGKGTTFTVRLPLTLTINHVLLCEVSDELYAIPLTAIESVMELGREEVDSLYATPAAHIEHVGRSYQFLPLAALLDAPAPTAMGPQDKRPVLLFAVGDLRVALAVDTLKGAREIVVKSLGPQIGRVREISGATILGDGRVVLILDMGALLRKGVALHGALAPETAERPVRERAAVKVLVVDDSITVRKVTSRILERHHMAVTTAKDGVDAVALFQQDYVPDIILMDIEMPRMDGYELAALVRNDARLEHVPIVMITSRTGLKHRERASQVGVDRYLGKPYQEGELVEAIHSLTRTH
jgi:chemosensory pili system protein ChpA (sensor histidine kinase/response regulator)